MNPQDTTTNPPAQLPDWAAGALQAARSKSKEEAFLYHLPSGEIVIVGQEGQVRELTDFPAWLQSVHRNDQRVLLSSLDQLIRGEIRDITISYRRDDAASIRYFVSSLTRSEDVIAGILLEETANQSRIESVSEQLSAVYLADQLAGVATAVYDFSKERSWASPAFLSWFRLQPEESPLPLITYADSVQESDKERVASEIHKILLLGGTKSIDHQAINPFGKKVWMRLRLDGFIDRGVVARIVATLTDITDQMTATTVLRQKDEQLRAAMEASFDAFMLLEAVYDQSGRIFDFRFKHLNRLSERLLGQDISALLGRSVRESLTKKVYRKFFFYYREALVERQTQVREEVFTVDGERRWYRHQVVPLSGAVAVTVSDVTSQRRDQQLLLDQKLELEAANTKLRNLARIDGLTGVYNRRAFDERLQEEIVRSDRYHTPLSLVIMDIDRFKLFNDNYGHQFGDEVLKHVANLLNQSARTTDFVARYGGEEFAAILPMTTAEEARLFAERFRNRLRESPYNGKAVTGSFGCAQHIKSENAFEELVHRADTAQYVSKNNGRDRVTVSETG
jgi:diguanylate cyclase (GGDEF)-like protein/PAS domain S-box-containing protein